MAKKILIVEDDPGIQLSLKDELESEGYVVSTANDGEEGLQRFQEKRPDLVILDIMLPLLNGYEVCKKLRQDGSKTPIIMLSVRDKEVDKVLGLELGADDYVTKPFSLREVVARVRALLRRTEDPSAEAECLRIGDLEVDFKRFQATKRGQPVEFTPLEFQILRLLAQKREQGIARDDFLDEIWGEENVVVTSRTVDSHIASIRKKIEDDPSHPQFIKSIRGVGYKLSE
jgi:two-component system alkaline phosphatase synthesis response regulator PhoP